MIARLKKAIYLLITPLMFLPSCASLPTAGPPAGHSLFVGESEDGLAGRFTPLFVIENDREAYNLIGMPRARLGSDDREEVYVDHESPAIFFEKRSFLTSEGPYTNLIYRIHFSEVPFSILPFYLGKGNNVGLFVVVTLNERGEPLLYTAVHTCGCYLAFLPTSYMPEGAIPDGWNMERQAVFGESLPGMLEFPAPLADKLRPFFLIRSGSHRVKDVWVDSMAAGMKGYRVLKMPILPAEQLEELPVEGRPSISFFETGPRRNGYVRGSHKLLERLLMSWWAFDWRIGEDKKLGKDKNHGPLFYTSLKPWEREDSDMRDFAAFLRYWGWKL